MKLNIVQVQWLVTLLHIRMYQNLDQGYAVVFDSPSRQMLGRTTYFK